jgi:hypothetical protein
MDAPSFDLLRDHSLAKLLEILLLLKHTYYLWRINIAHI